MLSVVYKDHFISIYSSAKSWNITEKMFQMANLEERLERLENAIGHNFDKVVSILFNVYSSR